MLTTANWITILIAIIGPIVAFAAAWGAASSQITALKEKVAELKQEMASIQAGRESNGKRMGALESDYRILYFMVTRGKTLTNIPTRSLTPNKDGEE